MDAHEVGFGEKRQAAGYAFEKYVADLFPKSKFDIVKTPTRYEDALDQDIRVNCEPDLCVMIKNTRFKIWIECKYVFKLVRVGEKANLNWTTKEKLQRYRDFERNSKDPVYVAVGVGGEPYSPERLFLAPLDELPYESLFESVYTKFERPTDAIIKTNYTLLQQPRLPSLQVSICVPLETCRLQSSAGPPSAPHRRYETESSCQLSSLSRRGSDPSADHAVS